MSNKGFSKSIGDKSSIVTTSIREAGGKTRSKTVSPEAGASAPQPTYPSVDVMPGEKSGGRVK